jgi:hypothetical protein
MCRCKVLESVAAYEHWYGRSPVCVQMCVRKSLVRAAAFGQCRPRKSLSALAAWMRLLVRHSFFVVGISCRQPWTMVAALRDWRREKKKIGGHKQTPGVGPRTSSTNARQAAK